MIVVEEILGRSELLVLREALDAARFVDGRATAGAAEAKRRKPMDSRTGSAMRALLLRRKWRRVFMVVGALEYSSHLGFECQRAMFLICAPWPLVMRAMRPLAAAKRGCLASTTCSPIWAR